MPYENGCAYGSLLPNDPVEGLGAWAGTGLRVRWRLEPRVRYPGPGSRADPGSRIPAGRNNNKVGLFPSSRIIGVGFESDLGHLSPGLPNTNRHRNGRAEALADAGSAGGDSRHRVAPRHVKSDASGPRNGADGRHCYHLSGPWVDVRALRPPSPMGGKSGGRYHPQP